MVDIIGRGTWIDKLAYEMIKREESLGRDTKLLRVESGLGASGIPHIGSIGDAVRAYGVKLALEDIGYESHLIAYSDDLDGLRKVPEGLPDSLEEHLAKPVSLIPDPYGCCDSYGMHMSGILLDGLDKIGINYEFRRAVDTYRKGHLKSQIHTILQKSTEIGQKISEMVGQEKYRQHLPYFPVCAKCDRIYTSESIRYDPERQEIDYRCTDTTIGSKTIQGCGHEGCADITRDLGKLAWKVEFAARWAAFDIRFEAYGKDIMDSVMINDWVADNILNFSHPHHIKYEMFLDKRGKKISKSLGNVMTVQRWLEFGSPESILLLLYKRITGARELGFEDIPSLMNEYNEIEDIYFGKIKVDNAAKLTKLRGLYEYVNLLDVPKQPSIHLNYRLLIELAKVFRDDRVRRVLAKIIEYGTIKESSPEIESLIEKAGKFADTFSEQRTSKIEIDSNTRAAIRDLVTSIPTKQDPQDISSTIYNTSRTHGIEPKVFFSVLYQIILGTTRGPRLGPLVADIGTTKISEMLSEYV